MEENNSYFTNWNDPSTQEINNRQTSSSSNDNFVSNRMIPQQDLCSYFSNVVSNQHLGQPLGWNNDAMNQAIWAYNVGQFVQLSPSIPIKPPSPPLQQNLIITSDPLQPNYIENQEEEEEEEDNDSFNLEKLDPQHLAEMSIKELHQRTKNLPKEQKNKITQMRRRLKNSASTKKRREKSSKLQQENEQLKKLLEDVTKGKNQNQSEL